jgi:hypothetical protein
MTYVCPLCKSPLTKDHYHNVLKLQNEQQRIQRGQVEALKSQIAAAVQKEKELRLKARKDAEAARQAGALNERKRTGRLMAGQAEKIKRLQEKVKMLKSGETHQSIGLADEPVLVARLQQEFPEDRIEHAGKGGDILHFVQFDSNEVGCIVYECKHTPRISGDHIVQTARAKATRRADYAILVTTGTRKGFSGLDHESGIFVVAQAGVLTLARICRHTLVSMAKAQLNAAARAATAQRLMDYIISPNCRTPLEQAIGHTERARKKLGQEMRQHLRDWKERYELYQTIHHDVSHVEINISRVLDGQDPLQLAKPKVEPLALPMA